MKTIIIPKEYFKPFKVNIKLATIKCAFCNEDVLDTPKNRLKNLFYLNSSKK